MKEAHIVHLSSVHRTLDPRIFHEECRSLVRAGYRVTLISHHTHDEVIDGVQIKAIARPKLRLARMTRAVWLVYRESLRQKGDLYQFHDPELIPVGLLLRAQGKMVIYDIHEIVPKTVLDKHYLPQWLRPLLAWIIGHVETLASSGFSALIAATPSVATRFKGWNPNLIVVHNFPPLDEFDPYQDISWSGRPFAVAYCGSISARRGIREMVTAMNLLSDLPDARLKLLGQFSPSNLRKQAERLPGWDRVDALGQLDRAGVIGVLSQVRAGLVLIHPPPRPYQDGYPIKMFEYMAMGLPVIASDRPLWRRIVHDAGCGVVVDPLDPSAIAKAIEYMLSHPAEAEAMGRRGREAVKRYYNWKGEERKLLELYAKLMPPDTCRAAVRMSEPDPETLTEHSHAIATVDTAERAGL